MGTFRIDITAVGGHGEARDVGDGGALPVEAYPEGSVDKVAFDAVAALKAAGASVESATLTHWPGEKGEVVDDLLAQKRKGGF